MSRIGGLTKCDHGIAMLPRSNCLPLRDSSRSTIRNVSVIPVKKSAAIIALVCSAGACGQTGPAPEPSQPEVIAAIFDSEGVEGTLVIESIDGGRRWVHNPGRAAARFSPASTFKIPNTLIGLHHGIVTSSDSVFRWDGKDRGVPAWNRDQTLESAFRLSCVWCYQQIARQVGSAAYIAELKRLAYGNAVIGDAVDEFWLDGSLSISAVEQIEFLRRVQSGDLPYSEAHLDMLHRIMIDDQSDDYTLRAKSGWTGRDLAVGWYVGYLESDRGTWLFALNMRMQHAEEAPLRKQLVVRTLDALGLF